jgi:hypothetical protein
LEAWKLFECCHVIFFWSWYVSWFSDPMWLQFNSWLWNSSFIECIKERNPNSTITICFIEIIHPFSHPNWICYPLITCMQNQSSFDFVKIITSPPPCFHESGYFKYLTDLPGFIQELKTLNPLSQSKLTTTTPNQVNCNMGLQHA